MSPYGVTRPECIKHAGDSAQPFTHSISAITLTIDNVFYKSGTKPNLVAKILATTIGNLWA